MVCAFVKASDFVCVQRVVSDGVCAFRFSFFFLANLIGYSDRVG